MFIRRAFLFIFVIVVAISLSTGLTLAQKGDWPKRIAIGSGAPGGTGFYMGATALANIIVTKMSGVNCAVEATDASKHNMLLLQKGMVQLGFTVTPTAWEGWNGVGFVEKTDRVRTLFTSWPSANMFTTLAKTGIKTMKDFEGKRFGAGAKNSAVAIFAEAVFDVLAIKTRMVYVPPPDAARQVADGMLAGFSLTWPNQVVTEMEAMHEVKIITLNKEELEMFSKKYPQYGRVIIPKGSYKAIKEDTESIGQYTITLVDKDLSEDFVYSLCKAAFENKAAIESIWPPMANSMNPKIVSNTPIPYHRGAVRYFKEQGASFPPLLIPPEMR